MMVGRTIVLLFLVAWAAWLAADAATIRFGAVGHKAAWAVGIAIFAAVYGYLTAPRRPL